MVPRLHSNFSITTCNFHGRDIETIIGMAVYHGDNEAWINQAIDSILEQTYKTFLFVIVVDGDVPQCINDVLTTKANQDTRIILAKNSANVGLAASMNNVINWTSRFSPLFFARMDADDISAPNRLERQVGYLRKHKYISVLGSALNEINEFGDKVGARVMPASHSQIVSMLPRRCSMNHPTLIIRYSVFEQGFLYDPDLKNTQDYFLWVTLAANGFVFRNLKDRLLDFRRVNDFYKRRGFVKSINEFKARFVAMRKLKRLTVLNALYATAVLMLRLMPSYLVKLAYKVDRHMLNRFGKH